MPRITVTFMDNSEGHFQMGDGLDPDDYYSWTPNPLMGLVFSRFTKGERTVIPWSNIKFYDVIIPGAPLRKFASEFMRAPRERCYMYYITHLGEDKTTESVRCFKSRGHDALALGTTPKLGHRHSAITRDGKYQVHWYNDSDELAEVKEVKSQQHQGD